MKLSGLLKYIKSYFVPVKELLNEIGEKRELFIITAPIEKYDTLPEPLKTYLRDHLADYRIFGGYESETRLAVLALSEKEALEKVCKDKEHLEHILGKVDELKICPRSQWWSP